MEQKIGKPAAERKQERGEIPVPLKGDAGKSPRARCDERGMLFRKYEKGWKWRCSLALSESTTDTYACLTILITAVGKHVCLIISDSNGIEYHLRNWRLLQMIAHFTQISKRYLSRRIASQQLRIAVVDTQREISPNYAYHVQHRSTTLRSLIHINISHVKRLNFDFNTYVTDADRIDRRFYLWNAVESRFYLYPFNNTSFCLKSLWMRITYVANKKFKNRGKGRKYARHIRSSIKGIPRLRTRAYFLWQYFLEKCSALFFNSFHRNEIFI